MIDTKQLAKDIERVLELDGDLEIIVVDEPRYFTHRLIAKSYGKLLAANLSHSEAQQISDSVNLRPLMADIIKRQQGVIRELSAKATTLADWCEDNRACGDWGFWDWQAGDAYSNLRASLDVAAPLFAGLEQGEGVGT